MRAARDPAFDEGVAMARLRFDLGQLAYDLRTRAGLTQRQLGERMGTTQSAIARLEAGGTNPTVELLHRLGEAVGVRILLTVDDHNGGHPATIALSGS